MSRTKTKERIKFYTLVFLVLLSLLQVGILWNLENYGVPTNFFVHLFAEVNTGSLSVQINDYIKPYRIIVSEGFDESHWILNESNIYFNKLWVDIEPYIKDILKSVKPINRLQFTKERWGDLVVKKSYIFEFNTLISRNLFKGFFNISESLSNDSPEGILKLIVLPFEDVDNKFIIYVYDGKEIFEYSMSINSNGLSRSDINTMFLSFKDPSSLLPIFSVIKEVIPNDNKSLFKISPDIPVFVENNKYIKLPSIVYKVPDTINTTNNKKLDIIKLADSILNEDKENYDYGRNVNDSIIFKSFNNIYTMNKDGVLEYRNLSDTEDSDKNVETQAFEKAITFIEERKKLISGVSIYLSSVKEDKENKCFVFSFDYKIGDYPIYFNDSNHKNVCLANAIKISANSQRVFNCQWYLGKFNILSHEASYNVNFEDMLEETFNQYATIDHKDFSIEDINISYIVDPKNVTSSINPSWDIKSMDNKFYLVYMNEQKGE